MSRVATIATIKGFKMEVATVKNYMDSNYKYTDSNGIPNIHVYKDILDVSSLEDIKKTIEWSIQEFRWATKECISAYGGGEYYYHGYHYVIENPEEGMDDGVYKVVKILDRDKKDDVVCCLNIFSEEKIFSKEILNHYNMQVVSNYFTNKEKEEINNLCKNGDMEFELWHKYEWVDGEKVLSKDTIIKLMPVTEVGFRFIKPLVDDHRGLKDGSSDLLFWLAIPYTFNNWADNRELFDNRELINSGELLKCNTGRTTGLYK